MTIEVGTQRAIEWLDKHKNADLTVSDWVVAEFSGALSVKMRAGSLTRIQQTESLALFAAWRRDALTVLSVHAGHFTAAARLADQYLQGLRSGDALHLAICADYGATLCTLDKRLVEAGPRLGITALLP